MNNSLDDINEDERNNINEETNEKKRREFTNITIDEDFKKLIIRVIKRAQDPNSRYYLSKQSTYESYHDELKLYFKKKYNKKPSQTDNLAFLLLLTYNEKMINNFNSINQLKLAFNNFEEESDFNPFGFEVGQYDHTCICNEPICNVHRFQNIYSGMVINIGSICNLRYGLINKNDPNYKSNDKKIKEYKEKQREIDENLPEGFYENKRQQEKNKKKDDNIFKKLNKLNEKAPGIYSSRKCYGCESNKIFKVNPKTVLLCSKCCPQTHIEKCRLFIDKIKSLIKECVSCKQDIISKKLLCPVCVKVYIMKKCKLCDEDFIDLHKSNDLYCEECDEKIIKCIDCKEDILKNSSNNTRCRICYNRFINNITVKKCEYCDGDFKVKENEKWKTCCPDCYVDNRISVKCQVCNNDFKKMKNENWKKICGPCYSKK